MHIGSLIMGLLGSMGIVVAFTLVVMFLIRLGVNKRSMIEPVTWRGWCWVAAGTVLLPLSMWLDFSGMLPFRLWMWPVIPCGLMAGIPLERWQRRRTRAALGRCPRCDYDLTGNPSGRCPECGAECRDPDRL